MTGDKQHDATTELNEALAAGFAAGNFDGVGPFYTEDATLMPPRGQFLEGRAAASAFWLSVSNRFGSVVFTTVAVKHFGDTVRRETGTYAMGGADGQTVQGKYVLVWQLVEGEWQIESSIWNRGGEAAAGGGRRPGQGQGQGQQRQGGGGGQGGGYRQGGAGGGYRQGGGQAGGQGGGYRQGAGRPSFQGGGGAGGRRQGGGGQGGGGQGHGGQGGGRQGGGQGGYGGGAYDGNAGLYATPKD